MNSFVKKIIEKFKDRDIFLCIPLGITAAVFLNQLIDILRLNDLFPAYSEKYQSNMFMYPLFTGIVIYGIVTPVFEELAFRWILFGRLRIYMETGAAALFSSIIFGIYHGNFIQFIYAFIFGLVLSFVFWRFDSTFASVFAHSAANITVYSIASTGGIDILSDVRGEVVSIIISGILTYFIIKRIYDSRPRRRRVIKKLPIFPRKF